MSTDCSSLWCFFVECGKLKELVLNIWFSCVTDKWTGTYIPPCQLSTQSSLLQVSFTQSHTIIQCVSVPKCFLTVVHTLTFQSTHWGKSEFCAQGCFNRRSPGLIHWPSNWLVICSSTWATAAHREQKVSQKRLWLDFCLLAHFSIVHCC